MKRKLAVLVLAGCSSVSPSGSNPGASPGTESGASADIPAQKDWVVHEWGTFTSMQTSTGTTLLGLHHEEERLPSFVYGRNGGTSPEPDAGGPPHDPKGVGDAPGGQISGVTQKLETPVLYFYAKDHFRAGVKVGFPGGILSEWYPNAKSYSPLLNQWSRIADGQMEWELDVSPGLTDFPFVSPEDVWAPSRNVASTPIAVKNEHEKFVFYRGLGAFEGPFRATSGPSDTLSFTNESGDAIPAAFLLRVHSAGGAIVPLGPIAGNATLANVSLPTEGKERNLDAYVDSAKRLIKTELEKSGLYSDEAQAMVDTWQRSYFKTPGVRVLYVVPRTWTDKLLPLEIRPAPTSLVRTMVGRVEILTRSEEQYVAAQISHAASAGTPASDLIASLGRFAEPKLRRALDLVPEGSKPYCQAAIAEAGATP